MYRGPRLHSLFLVAEIHSHSPKLRNAKSSAVIGANFPII